MPKTVINPPGVPKPGGAYSPGISCAGFVYTAGLGPQDPVTGEIVGDDIESQTRQVLTNLAAVLAGAELSLSNVVKATVHLQELKRDFAGFNAVYKQMMPEPLPVRTTVGSQLMDILVEIDFVASADA